MLFDPEIECPDDLGNEGRVNNIKKNAMNLFVMNEEDGTYSVTVKSILKLNMLVKFIAVGVSFRQASKLYQSVKEETGMGVLGSASTHDVALKCRILCSINLQYLKELLNNVWCFAIGLDAGNNAGTAYLDVRVRFYIRDNIHNFHLMAIPMKERHTGEYQFDLVTKLLGILAPNWRYQLVGIATDGASTMTGCISGTCTRLAREFHSSIYRIWCGAHQLDLVVKKAFSRLCNETFLDTLTSMTGHLRRQQNLIREMKSACPTFVSTRWISMGKVLRWMKDNRLRLLQHFNEKNPTALLRVNGGLSSVSFSRWWIERRKLLLLQGMNTLVCEQ
jgi:hypothetical protein